MFAVFPFTATSTSQSEEMGGLGIGAEYGYTQLIAKSFHVGLPVYIN